MIYINSKLHKSLPRSGCFVHRYNIEPMTISHPTPYLAANLKTKPSSTIPNHQNPKLNPPTKLKTKPTINNPLIQI